MSETIFNAQWKSFKKQNDKKKYFLAELKFIPKIVYLDDEIDALEVFKDQVESYGFECFVTHKYSEAINYIKHNKTQIVLVVSDFNMPELNAFEFRKKILTYGNIPFVVLSGFIDKEMALKGMELKISSFIDKPIHLENFFNVVESEINNQAFLLKDELELLEGFVSDAEGLIESIEDIINELMNNPEDQESIARIYGMVHTLKGSSGFFEPKIFHEFSHRFEDYIKEIQSGAKKLNTGTLNSWLKATDTLKLLITEFKNRKHNEYNINELLKIFNEEQEFEQKNSSKNSSSNLSGIDKNKKTEEIKVSINVLDEFMKVSGEMTVIRNMLNKTVIGIEQKYRGDKDIGSLKELLEEMHKMNTGVQNKVIDMRRVSAKSITRPLIRTVRETAKAIQKDIQFIVNGDDLRIDHMLADILNHSLVHLLRNSIDHGLETNKEREESGKNSKGKIELSFDQQEEFVTVKVQDDGRGINTKKIKEKIVEKNLKNFKEVEKMSEFDLHQMIFAAGFSTAEKTTEFSGRGVGMSMVKDSVESIGGALSIESKAGLGSIIKIILPIPKSVLISSCLLLKVNNETFGIEEDAIQRVLVKNSLNSDQYFNLEGTYVYKFENHLIPVLSLSEVLGIKNDFKSEYLIILKTKKHTFGLLVDEILEIEDTVIKQLSFSVIKNLNSFLGGTFLGDGTIGLILDVDKIADKNQIILHVNNKNDLEKNNQNSLSLNSDHDSWVTFKLGVPGIYCTSQSSFLRIEKINKAQIQKSAGKCMLSYREDVLVLIDVTSFFNNDSLFHVKLDQYDDEFNVLVCEYNSIFYGLIVNKLIDLEIGERQKFDNSNERGILGRFILKERAVCALDIKKIMMLSTDKSSSKNQKAA